MIWWQASLLGVVEGLTEFLPISSTGHLILVGHWLGLDGPVAAAFDVIIQLGAILAVVVLYWKRFWGLVKPQPGYRFTGVRGLLLLFLTSLPASLLGLATHSAIKKYLFGPQTVAWALAAGAVMIFVVEAVHWRARKRSLDDITPGFALGVGFFQCLALWPGFSRSAATIMGGMILGARREVAAEYSFIAAVPIMVAATGYDFVKNFGVFGGSDLAMLAVGFVVSFFAAWAAVKGFILLLSKLSLRPFAWYRLVLAAIVLLAID
ncbi:MAG: undecaprenyl-diphosphatase [Desulfovibrionales bacterium]|nr:undecaprenyl-diphosphatase [Desulfovibrionales bacterium]